MNNPALDALRHHVTGAIERGEKEAIVEKPVSEKFCIQVEDGGFITHRDRTAWSKRTANKHAKEFTERHGKQCKVVPEHGDDPWPYPLKKQ